MITVKVSIRGAGKNLDMSQFIGGPGNQVGDVQFRVNDGCTDADVWFVVEEPEPEDAFCRVPRTNVFFLSAETSWPPGHYAESPARMAYLSQFARIFTCHDVFLDSATYSIPFLPWMINGNHGDTMFAPHKRDLAFFRDLKELDKSKSLSVFCSAQAWTASHRLRLRFVQALKAHFGDDLDWYGNGIRSVAEKWDGLAPYRYTIVLENQSSPNVITEKIQDAFLGLSYPIYWGAPNVTQYFPESALTAVDIKDLRGALTTIERVLAEDPYDGALPALVESKRRVLEELNFLHRMARIAALVAPPAGGIGRESVRILSVGDFETRLAERQRGFAKRSGALIERVGRRLQR